MRKKSLILLFLILIAPLAVYPNGEDSIESQTNPNVYPYKRDYNYKDIVVEKVIDADTIELADGRRLKLIGVELPKTQAHKAASQSLQTFQYYQFLKEMIEGKKINIELDVEKYDQYGRLLAYVYLSDGTFVNAEVLRRGYGQPRVESTNTRYKDTFFRLYKEAKDNKRGLWK